MVKELVPLNTDIAALSKVHFAKQGSLMDNGAGYITYWTRSLLVWKEQGQAQLLSSQLHDQNSIARKLQNLPVGHSDCITSLRLPIQDNKFATALIVYTPTQQADTAV